RENKLYNLQLESEVEKRTKQVEQANINLLQLNNRLRQSEEKFRTYTESAPVAIIIYQDAGWIYANPAAEQLMAASLIELSSLEFNDIIHPDFRHIYHNNRITNLSDAFLKNSHELKIIARDGSEKWVNFRAEKIEFEGKNAVMVSAMDIGDLKQAEIEKQQLEIQLRQAQKMESIGTLAGGIAHDFNNILSSVIGYTELTLADMSEGKPASKQNLQAILRAGERARDLVSQILTFSRQTELVNIPIKMHMIANEVLKLLRSSIPTTIEIIHKIQKCKPILADPTQIHQVIMNLCTNAFHAMQGSGGVMTVTLSPIEIQAQDSEKIAELSPGSYAKLEVIDTGTGMSQSTIERIFDPYFTTKEKGKGTGLGLAVVHGIVNNHNGAITVESIPGQGSTFRVFLPVVDDSEMQITSRKKQLPRGTEHILLVDDEKEIVLIEQQMLERLGYKVTTRAGSMDALTVFQASPLKFDMIITDMTMPNMTGDQLACEIIKIRPEIPIILCTGFSEYMNNEKAKSMGIRKFVLKPVSMEEIATAIRDVLDGERLSTG
ncbi:MAG: response regulator, partial [Deltaproteobacteria bacterium]